MSLGRRVRDETSCEPQGQFVQLERALAFFTRARPWLFGVAYRILGNAADAEDVVQNVWMRWQRCDRAAVEAPAAFLATTASRLAINAIQSARARHETHLDAQHSGQSVVATDPVSGAEQREALEAAVLVLLEKLSPAERAAYVLREAFEYPYEHIAALIETSEAATRQLVSRARKRLASGRRQAVDAREGTRLTAALVAAAQTGHLGALEQLLTAAITSTTRGVRVPRMSPESKIGHRRIVQFRRRTAGQPAPISKPQAASTVGTQPFVSPDAA